MKLRQGLLTAVAAVATAAFAAPAAAVTVVVTYTGTVYQSYDEDNLFGSGFGYGALDGDTFVASFTFDSTVGVETDGGTFRDLYGDFTLGSNPITAASIRINGHTEDLGSWLGSDPAPDAGRVQQSDEDPVVDDRVYHYQYNYGAGHTAFDFLEARIRSSANNIVNTTDYTTPLTYTVQAGDETYGFFDTYLDVGATNRAYGNLTITGVTIAQLNAAIPEPATWAMMILGFGVAGGAMRRRRRLALPHA